MYYKQKWAAEGRQTHIEVTPAHWIANGIGNGAVGQEHRGVAAGYFLDFTIDFIDWLKRRRYDGGSRGWIYGRERWRWCSLSDCGHKSRDRPASCDRNGGRVFCQPLLETMRREGKAGKQVDKEVRMHFDWERSCIFCSFDDVCSWVWCVYWVRWWVMLVFANGKSELWEKQRLYIYVEQVKSIDFFNFFHVVRVNWKN